MNKKKKNAREGEKGTTTTTTTTTTTGAEATTTSTSKAVRARARAGAFTGAWKFQNREKKGRRSFGLEPPSGLSRSQAKKNRERNSFAFIGSSGIGFDFNWRKKSLVGVTLTSTRGVTSNDESTASDAENVGSRKARFVSKVFWWKKMY